MQKKMGLGDLGSLMETVAPWKLSVFVTYS